MVTKFKSWTRSSATYGMTHTSSF